MDAGYFQSRHFLVATAIAALLVGGAAAAYTFAPSSFTVTWEDACASRVPAGAPLDARRVTNDEGGERTVTFTLNVTDLVGGIVDACTTIGDIDIVSAPGNVARVVFTIEGEPGAVGSTVVEAAFARTAGGGLAVSAWQARAGESVGFFGQRGASASLRIELPETGPYDMKAIAVVGDATLRDLLVGDVKIVTDVGDIVARSLDVQGNVTLVANVGSVDASLASLAAARVDVDADVGEIVLRLPSRTDIGYDVKAQSHVGETNVDIGATERSDHREDGVGSTYTARSSGFATKPTQVFVTADANVGSVHVEVRG